MSSQSNALSYAPFTTEALNQLALMMGSHENTTNSNYSTPVPVPPAFQQQFIQIMQQQQQMI